MREAAVTSAGVDRRPPYRSSETSMAKLSGSLMFDVLFPLVTTLLLGCRLAPGLVLVIIFFYLCLNKDKNELESLVADSQTFSHADNWIPELLFHSVDS